MSHLHCVESPHRRVGFLKQQNRHGVTLLELVIVLVILVALTGIAVQSLEPIADQARYDATKQTLENVRDAIQSRSSDNGSVDFSGFISDMGRLPRGFPNAGPPAALQLNELWDGTGLNSFSIQPFNDPFVDDDGDPMVSGDEDQTISVARGWRGPYLLLSPGTNFILDGYGNPFDLWSNDVARTPADPLGGDFVVNLRSRGADGTPDTADDLELPIGVFQSDRINGNMLSASVIDVSTGSAYTLGSGERLFVRIYGPSPTDVLGSVAVLANAELPTGQGILTDHNGNRFEVTCGIRSIRAIVVTNVTESGTLGPQPNESEIIVKRSAVQQVVIKPGQCILPTLYLE